VNGTEDKFGLVDDGFKGSNGAREVNLDLRLIK
jgi:hypothetical protein